MFHDFAKFGLHPEETAAFFFKTAQLEAGFFGVAIRQQKWRLILMAVKLVRASERTREVMPLQRNHKPTGCGERAMARMEGKVDSLLREIEACKITRGITTGLVSPFLFLVFACCSLHAAMGCW